MIAAVVRRAEGSLVPQVAIALAALLWGLWWLPLRGLETLGLGGSLVSVALYGFCALGLLPFLWTAGRRDPRALRAAAGSTLAAGIFCGIALAFWNHALLIGEVVRVTLLFYLAPIWATLLAAVFLGERLTLRRLTAIALGLGGAAAVLGLGQGSLQPAGLSDGLADWLAILAGVTFAVSTTIIRRVERGTASGAVSGGATAQTFASLAWAAVVAWILVLLDPAAGSESPLRLLPLGLAAVVALLWLLPGLWLILWGAGRVDPGRVAILLLLEVVAAAASAALLTDEPFGGREALGCVLILGAGLVDAGADRALLARRRARAAGQ